MSALSKRLLGKKSFSSLFSSTPKLDESLFSSSDLADRISNVSNILLRDTLEWSFPVAKDGPIWRTGTVQITSKGVLVACRGSSPADEVLVEHIQESLVYLKTENLTIHINPVRGQPVILGFKSRDVFIAWGSALAAWARLRAAGSASKHYICPAPLPRDSVEPLLVCHVKALTAGAADRSTESAAWFSCLAVLQRDGVLKLLQESSGSELFEIKIRRLLRQEIFRLGSELVLHLGVNAELRQSFPGLIIPTDPGPVFTVCSKSDGKFSGSSGAETETAKLLFTLPADIEDWLLALHSCAMAVRVGPSSQQINRSFTRVSRLGLDLLNFELEPQYRAAHPELHYYYLELCAGNTLLGRTGVLAVNRHETVNTVFYKEEFRFEPLATSHGLSVRVKKAWGSRYREEDAVLGSVELDALQLETSDGVEQWCSVVADKPPQTPVGHLLFRGSLEKAEVMAASRYAELEALLLQPVPAGFLARVSQAENLARASQLLLEVYISLQHSQQWIGRLMDYELGNVMQQVELLSPSKKGSQPVPPDLSLFNTAFRGNSLFSKTVELYSLRLGRGYVEKAIGKAIRQIARENFDCEVDPARAEDPEGLTERRARLSGYADKVWRGIRETASELPQELQWLFPELRTRLARAIGDEYPAEHREKIVYNAVTGFLFLRFLCPAVLNPKLFGLLEVHPTVRTKRTLTLLAKILQTFANRAVFTRKEAYMVPFNEFIEGKKPELLKYLAQVTEEKIEGERKRRETGDRRSFGSEIPRPKLRIPPELLRELPTLPHYIDRNLRYALLIQQFAPESGNGDGDGSGSGNGDGDGDDGSRSSSNGDGVSAVEAELARLRDEQQQLVKALEARETPESIGAAGWPEFTAVVAREFRLKDTGRIQFEESVATLRQSIGEYRPGKVRHSIIASHSMTDIKRLNRRTISLSSSFSKGLKISKE